MPLHNPSFSLLLHLSGAFRPSARITHAKCTTGNAAETYFNFNETFKSRTTQFKKDPFSIPEYPLFSLSICFANLWQQFRPTGLYIRGNARRRSMAVVEDPLCERERYKQRARVHVFILFARIYHASKECARHFLLAFMGHVKGVWNLSIAFLRDTELEGFFVVIKNAGLEHFHPKRIF